MNRNGLLFFLLTLSTLCFAGGLTDYNVTSTYRHHLTGRRMERLNINNFNSDTIDNDSVHLKCRVNSYSEISCHREDLKRGETTDLNGSAEYGVTLKKRFRTNNYVVEKIYYGKSGKIRSYKNFYEDPHKKGAVSPVGMAYEFDSTGKIDSTNYNQIYKITPEDILIHLQKNYRPNMNNIYPPDSVLIEANPIRQSWWVTSLKFRKSRPHLEIDGASGRVTGFADTVKHVYPLPFSALETPDSLASERLNYDGFHTDTLTKDSVKTASLARKIKYIYYESNRIMIVGNTTDGFQEIIYKSANSSKPKEELFFDGEGNLVLSRKFDAVYGDTTEFREYDPEGNLLKETHYEKEFYRFSLRDLKRYVKRQLVADIETRYLLTALNRHPKMRIKVLWDNNFNAYKSGIVVTRSVKHGRHVWSLHIYQMQFKDAPPRSFTVDIDGNSGDLINIDDVFNAQPL